MVPGTDRRRAWRHPQDDDRGLGAQAARRPVAAGDDRRGPARGGAASGSVSRRCGADDQARLGASRRHIADAMPMTVRGGGDPRQAWLARRLREWARRLGATPLMRMTASWFGSASDPPNTSVWREVPRPMASSPRIRLMSGIRGRERPVSLLILGSQATGRRTAFPAPNKEPSANQKQPSRNVTVTIDNRRSGMPRHRLLEVPLTAAERQARRRAKLRRQAGRPPTAPARRLPPRPSRWAAAVAVLIALQDEYRTWFDNLPDNLEGSRLADKLQTIAELDLDELQAIDPPRGYGRD